MQQNQFPETKLKLYLYIYPSIYLPNQIIEVEIQRYHKYQIPYDYTVEVRNRFKGLDLIDRVPDELWTEVHDIVQETGIKTIPMEKKSKKAKWLSEEALQIAVKRKEVKSKGEKKRYSHLNAEIYSKEQQGEIRKPSSVINAKKQRKTTEWERLEISSRKLKIQGNISCKDGPDKGQKWYGPNRSRRYLRRDGKNTQKNCPKKIFTTQIITMV